MERLFPARHWPYLTIRQITSQALTFALLFSTGIPALAETGNTSPVNHFGDNWQARPLRDLSPKAPVLESPYKAKSKAPALTAEQIDARLAPYEPFIREVEQSLAIKPSAGMRRVARLNAIQDAVFDGQPYKGDAGELIGRLQAIFPQEAAKTAALMPAPQQNANNAAASTGNGPQIVSSTPATSKNSARPVSRQHRARPTRRKASNDFDDPFKDDPFFRDDADRQSSNMDSGNGPSKMKSVGLGLAGVATLATVVAGGYALNKSIRSPQYNNYGYPGYGYGGYGYGMHPQAFYGGYQPYNPYNANNTIQSYRRLYPNANYATAPVYSPSYNPGYGNYYRGGTVANVLQQLGYGSTAYSGYSGVNYGVLPGY